MRKKQDISISTTPIEITIPLLEPVKIYTAKELAAMPLSKMIECRDAQEEHFIKCELTLSIGARNARDLMKKGEVIKVTFEKKRVHTYAVFKLGGGDTLKTNNQSISASLFDQSAAYGGRC